MLREFFAGLSIVIALIIFGFSLTQPLITIYQLWIFSSIWVVMRFFDRIKIHN